MSKCKLILFTCLYTDQFTPREKYILELIHFHFPMLHGAYEQCVLTEKLVGHNKLSVGSMELVSKVYTNLLAQ